MNVLVTGGAGFIGTNLIKRLLTDGHNVISFDNYTSGSIYNHQAGAQYVNAVINPLPFLLAENKFDVCYHLAAMARIQPSFVHTTQYFHSNVALTQQVLQGAYDYGYKVIYAGSSSKYAGIYRSPYAHFKWIGEQLCQMYLDNFDISVNIARFYNVYGAHEITSGEQAALIGKWRGLIEQGEKLPIVGDGKQTRDFTHVDDIVDGLIALANYTGNTLDFDLGRGVSYSINDVFDMFKQRYPHILSYTIDDMAGNYPQSLCVDYLAMHEIKWNPTRNLSDYIASL